MASKRPRVLGLLVAMIGFAASVLGTAALAAPGVPDEAQQAGRDAASFPAADEDYFQAMDNGLPLTPDEVKGRNMWLVWTGGNDRFWDRLTHDTFGAFDLLKTISSHPKLKNRRGNRWNYLGLTNEPCFDEATGPDPKRFGLWLDQRRADCPADPFANDAEVSRRRDRRARQEPAGRVLLRRAHGHPGPAPVPQPGIRRGRGQEVGCGALLQRPRLLQLQGPRAPLPGRHVLRLLPCRPEPDRAAGRSREPEMGEHQRDGGLPVFLDRPDLRLGRRSGELHVPAGPHPAAGHARHLAGVDRLHQQSAHDERDLQSRPAARAWPSAGARRRWRAAS